MGNGKAIAGMVLGILSIVFMITGYAALIMGILAMVFSGLSLQKEKTGRGLAITGLVTGIIGTIFGFIYAIIWTAVASI